MRMVRNKRELWDNKKAPRTNDIQNKAGAWMFEAIINFTIRVEDGA